MPRVVVNPAPGASLRSGDRVIRVNERPATFFLRALPVPSPVIYQMTPRTFDLLLIAASVFTADSLTSRGGTGRSDAGADWYRDLRFVIPVADPEFWRAEHDRLVAVLEFLTGDRFSFAFDRRARREPAQRHLLQDHPPAEAEQVVLFSGGLDSLTGALESLAGEGPRPLLVSHCSATKTIAVQKALYRKLKCRFPGKILWVPADGTLKRVDAKERTQRSRSFLYGALGYAAASLVGANRVSFYENGVVSVNLPFSGQVIGTMATRTTHPLFLSRLGALFSRMAERPITVDNPYAAMTKTEVVTRLRNLDGADLIGKTTSCSSVWTRTRKYPLCGCCSQCLDRRFAILAAGLEAHDPADRYEVDLFLGQRKRELDRTMANDWTRHAGRRLARMSLHQFGTEFAAEIADVVAGYPESQIAHVISEIFEMHRRHGEAVARVVKQTIADEAPRIADGAVPPDTLLAATVTSGRRSFRGTGISASAGLRS